MEKQEKVRRHIEMSVFGLINYVSLVVRSDTFIDAYRLCEKTERKMKQIGMIISYTICRWTIFFLYGLTFSSFGSMFIIFLINNENLELLSWEMLVMGIPICLMTSPMYNFVSFGALLYSRFNELNKLIEHQLCVEFRRVDVDLLSLAEMHSDLCKSANKLIYAGEYLLLTYHLFTFVQLGEFVLNLMGYYKFPIDHVDILWNVLFMVSNIAAISLITLVKYESILIGPVLCELTEAYFNDEINEQVNMIPTISVIVYCSRHIFGGSVPTNYLILPSVQKFYG